MSTSNLNAFNRGWAKALKAIKKQTRTMWIDLARDVLYDAVQTWSGYNMTGNTINSYACAVYENGKMLHFFSAYDVGVNDRPTAEYSYPGDYIYFYHQNSLSGEDNPNYSGSGYVQESTTRGRVRQYNPPYKFQEVGRGRGDEDAKKFLRDFKADKGLQIVVVVGVPYATYLENVRHLDVLVDNHDNAKQIADSHIRSIKPLQL